MERGEGADEFADESTASRSTCTDQEYLCPIRPMLLGKSNLLLDFLDSSALGSVRGHRRFRLRSFRFLLARVSFLLLPFALLALLFGIIPLIQRYEGFELMKIRRALRRRQGKLTKPTSANNCGNIHKPGGAVNTVTM